MRKPSTVLRYLWSSPPRAVWRRFWSAVGLQAATEEERLRACPRRQPTTAHLFGHTIDVPDAASYLSAKHEIIDAELYKFACRESEPLIIDCGANIGLSVIYFKRLHPDARVIAFEPEPEIFTVLRKNVGVFGFAGVELRAQAVWDRNGTVDFCCNGADAGRLATLTGQKGSLRRVEAVRLRNLLDRPVSLLKLDIEGAEYAVLSDCRDRLRNVERLFVELHSFVNRPQQLSMLFRLLEEEGYRVHVASHGIHSPQPFVEQHSDGEIDLLLNVHAFRRHTKGERTE